MKRVLSNIIRALLSLLTKEQHSIKCGERRVALFETLSTCMLQSVRRDTTI